LQQITFQSYDFGFKIDTWFTELLQSRHLSNASAPLYEANPEKSSGWVNAILAAGSPPEEYPLNSPVGGRAVQF
jgi:hypothetical protein